MKKVFILIVAVSALAIASCGGKKDDKKEGSAPAAPVASGDASGDATGEH